MALATPAAPARAGAAARTARECRHAGRLTRAPQAPGRRSALVARASLRREQGTSSSSPQDKVLRSLVDTGIRGSVAVLAASALHLSLFSHASLDWDATRVGLQFALPVIGMEIALLLAADFAAEAPAAAASDEPAQQQQQQQQQQPVTQEAIDLIYLQQLRYSLLGAAPPAQQLALEAGAQLSEELLARGVMLLASAGWVAARLGEAGLCEQPAVCSAGAEWVAAAAICSLMAARYSSYALDKTRALKSQLEAAAAEAAARAALLRYEPLAVQQAAAAAAAGGAPAEPGSARAARSEAVARLVGVWLGSRFVLGQACMFGAFLYTDNLLASAVAGLAMTLLSNVTCGRYLQRSSGPA